MSSYLIRTFETLIYGHKVIFIDDLHHVKSLNQNEVLTKINTFLLQNPKTFFLLEYHDSVNKSTIESYLIQEIIQTYSDNKILPSDIRLNFLTPKDNYLLYHQKDFSMFDKQTLIKKFIIPFFSNINLFIFSPTNNFQNYLINALFEHIKNEFEFTLNFLQKNSFHQNNQDINKIVTKLKFLWMKVYDFFILKKITFQENFNYIVILGTHHYDHIVIDILKENKNIGE